MPPANLTAATAIDLGTAPASVTQQVDEAGTTYTVWYRWTAPASGLNEVAVWAFGDLVTYRPVVGVYLGPVDELPTWLDIASQQNRPIQHPVVGGTTYYYRILTNSGNPAPANLTLTLKVGPSLATEAGSLLVNDDTAGFPAVVLSGTTGAIQQFLYPCPAGESGDVLSASGVYLLNAAASDTLSLFGATHTPVAVIPFNWTGAQDPAIRANQGQQVFYVGDPSGAGAAVIHTLTGAGAWGPTTWTLTGHTAITRIAAANDGSVLYFCTGALNQPIHRWTLTTDTATTDLVAAVTGYGITDLLVLQDDSIVALYIKSSATRDVILRQYDPAGGTLASVDLSDGTITSTNPRLAYALDDPATVWVWLHRLIAGGEVSNFLNVRLADGVAVTTLTVPVYEGGAYQNVATETFPGFGTSFSCPFLVLRTASAGGDGATAIPPHVAPSYALEERLIRRLRRAPHVAQEHARLFYRRFELDLERGVGVANGQGSDPLVQLRISRDGGQTWSEPWLMSAGALGAYTTRVIARRLGSARDAVFEVTVSDPVAWSLVQAWLDLEAGTS